jgi:hypothetical protein
VGAVHPDVRRRPSDERRRLRDLVLVVGEHVVLAPGVDVESRPQVAEGHCRALEVPAREALAPAAGPAEVPVRVGRLPEREVGWVTLVGLDLAPMPGPQVVQGVA